LNGIATWNEVPADNQGKQRLRMHHPKFNVRFTNLAPLDPQWKQVSYDEVQAATATEAEAKARALWERDHPSWSSKPHSVKVVPAA
jgi:hypothetical protein